MSFALFLSRWGLRAGLRTDLGTDLRAAVPGARAAGYLGLATVTLALGGCPFGGPTTADMYPKLTPEARAVRIYYSGEQPECAEVLSLGKVQAHAGGFPDPQHPKAPVNMDVALAWLRLEAWKMGGNGVRLLDHKGNSNDTVHMAIGEAIFCRTNN